MQLILFTNTLNHITGVFGGLITFNIFWIWCMGVRASYMKMKRGTNLMQLFIY